MSANQTYKEDLSQLRETVATACRILAYAGLVEGVLGHVSARVGEDRMLIRCRGPRERGLMFTTAEDIQIVTLDGGGEDRDSRWSTPKELAIHGEILRARPQAGAVVHAHPPAALTVGLAELTPRPVFGAFNIPALTMARDGVPVYPRSVLITRPQLASELIDAMAGKDICLMRGHGVTVSGATVRETVIRALDLNVLLSVTRELALLGAEPPEVPEGDLAELPDVGSEISEASVWRYYETLSSLTP